MTWTLQDLWREDTPNAQWTRYGYTPLPFTDSFTIGTDKPGPGNTGPRTDTSTYTHYTGTLTLNTPGQVFQNFILDGNLVIAAPNVTVQNFVINIPSGGGSNGRGIYVFNAGVTGWTVQYGRITAATPTTYTQSYCIQGSGGTVHRCDLSGTVDGISIAGINQRAGMVVTANYIHGLVHYGNPPDTGHSDGSHNDCIQCEGNLTTVLIRGNYFRAGYTSCNLITQDNGTYDSAPQIWDNWYDVEDTTAGSLLNVKSSMTAIPGLSIKRNRFTKAYPAKARIILAPTHLAIADISYTGADRNVYDDGSSDVVPVYDPINKVQLYTYP